jgi:O-antigen ligase
MNTKSFDEGREGRPAAEWGEYISFPAILWMLLWFGINAGPSSLTSQPQTALGWVHCVRAAFPLIVLVASIYVITSHRAQRPLPLSMSLRLWSLYGFVSLAACVMWPASERWPNLFQSLYWSFAFLAGIAAVRAYLQGQNLVEKARMLNHISWIVGAVFLGALVMLARGKLIEGSGLAASGYGSYSRMPSIIDMPMSRASGVARFAAIPGVVCFVLLLRSRGWQRLVWGGMTFVFAALIYWMQSRGALLGFGAAVVFGLLSSGQKMRHMGVFMLVLLMGALLLNVVPAEIMDHLTRRESMLRAGLLTGRTRAWSGAVNAIMESPLWGWGFQADRLLLHEHVHNTVLYALLSAGFVGGIPFLVGVLIGWRQFFKLYRSGYAVAIGHGTMLVQAGSLLAFFTVRGMSEVCGAMFGVDYMVMVPILAYLGLMSVASDRAATERPA